MPYKTLFVFLFMVSLLPSSSSTKIENFRTESQSLAPFKPSIKVSKDSLDAILEFLGDDRLGGRHSPSSSGNIRARDFLVKWFKDKDF